MQIVIGIAGVILLLAGALLALLGIAWIALVSVRHLPLVGRRGRR